MFIKLVVLVLIQKYLVSSNFFFRNSLIVPSSTDIILWYRRFKWVNNKWVFFRVEYFLRSPYSQIIHKTQMTRNIKPLQSKDSFKKLLGVIDIETIVYKDKLIPYAVGVAYLVNDVVQIRTFYITSTKDIETCSLRLLKDVCSFIKCNLSNYTLYAHNLGKFDGYLLIKPFFNYFGVYKILLDKSRNIICINLPGNIIIKDSLRILPYNLKKLGELFNTDHQKLDFDHSTAKIQTVCDQIFKDRLLEYLTNDLLCLLEVMIKASNIIISQFNVDLTDCYSISSLAFKIFRTKFILQDSIPVLPFWLDKIIRKGYRGGSVDVYRVKGDKAYYYDVNSLYPYSITKLIPYKYLGFKLRPNLNIFFGFAIASIYIPKNVKVPLVGVLSETNTLYYPTGYTFGLYFYEELKAFIKQGYKVHLFYGYEFDKVDIFSKYVETLYKLKSTSSGCWREIYKLLLNGLYGYFGRNPITISIAFKTQEEIKKLVKTNNLLDIIEMNNEISIVIFESLPDKKLCEENNISYNSILKKTILKTPLMTNVAIASAITSYSRIHIHQFKTIPNNELLYTDTDSVFLLNPLDSKYIDPTLLGYMKDELKGDLIIDYIFLEPKLYYYKTQKGKVTIRARGVPTIINTDGNRTSMITPEIITKLWKGESVFFTINRLRKSFINIEIKEQTINYTVTREFNRKIPIYSNGQLIEYRPKYIPFIKLTFKN